MAYEGITHARSHRVPFAGLGRAPGYMGNYCGDGSSMGAAPAGGGWGAAVAEGFKATSVIADIAGGGLKSRERESRRNLEAARLQAQAAAGNAQAQVEVARLQAEAAVAAARAAAQGGGSNKKTLIIVAAVGGVAVLGALGYFLLKK